MIAGVSAYILAVTGSVSDGTIKAEVTAGGSSAPTPVTITTTSGATSNKSDDKFFLLNDSAPGSSLTIGDGLDPVTVYAGGDVTLNGTNLPGATKVQFYQSKADSPAYIDATSTVPTDDTITAFVPTALSSDSGTGTYFKVVVTGSTGASSPTVTSSNTCMAGAVKITKITGPGDSTSAYTGQTLTITGTNFVEPGTVHWKARFSNDSIGEQYTSATCKWVSST